MRRVLLLLAALTASCANVRGTQPVYTEADFAADVLHKILLRQKEIRTLKGYAELTYISREKTRTFLVGFARVPPGKTRLEISGPLGELLLLIVADDDRMMAYYKAEKEAVVCETTRENLAALTGMDFGADLHRVLDWAEGRIPTYPEKVATGEILIKASENADGSATVTWIRNEGEAPIQTITVSPDERVVLSARVFNPDGTAETDIYYDNFVETDGYLTPKTVSINREESFSEILIERIEINGKIKEVAFSTEPPEGAKTYFWAPASDANKEDL